MDKDDVKKVIEESKSPEEKLEVIDEEKKIEKTSDNDPSSSMVKNESQEKIESIEEDVQQVDIKEFDKKIESNEKSIEEKLEIPIVKEKEDIKIIKEPEKKVQVESTDEKPEITIIKEKEDIKISVDDENVVKLNLIIKGITCITCANKVRDYVQKLQGIKKIVINYITQKGLIEYDMSLCDELKIIEQIKKIGYEANKIEDDSKEGKIIFQIVKKNLEGEGEGENETSSIKANEVIKYFSSLNEKWEIIPSVYEIKEEKNKEFIHVQFNQDLINPRKMIKLIEEKFSESNTTLLIQMKKGEGKLVNDALLRKREIKFHSYWFIFSCVLTVPIFVLSVILKNINVLNICLGGTDTIKRKENVTACGLSYPIYRTITPLSISVMVLTIPVHFVAGCYFYKLGVKAVFLNCSADKNTLLSISCWMAFITSLISIIYGLFEPRYKGHDYLKTTAILVTFLHLGAILENYARRRTSDSLTKLMGLQPKRAVVIDNVNNIGELKTKIQNKESIVEKDVHISMVWRNDIIKVLPGEKIMTDGVCVLGESMVDQSMITGESRSVEIQEDSEVIGGSLNMNGIIYVKVLKTVNENLLSKIIEMVENSFLEKTKLQGTIDKVVKYYVPLVASLSILVYIAWVMFSFWVVDEKYLDGIHPIIYAILPATSILVIACPCALGFAIPIIVLVASGIGARHGVLFKGGGGMEMMTKVNIVCFDKTGTLTYGELAVEKIIFEDDYWKKNVKEFLLYLGSCENCIKKHPIAQTLLTYIKTNSDHKDFKVPDENEYINGMGLKCVVDEETWLVGNARLMKENNVELKKDDERIKGRTIVYVAVEGDIVALITLIDQVKPEMKWVINKLKEMKKKIYMLTGDNDSVAKKIAGELGIDNVESEMTPFGKAEFIKELQKKDKKNRVMFMGDGINDSIGLAQANVSVSISSGTEIAIECSDIVLMKKNMYYLIVGFDIARKSYFFMILNLFWAFIYNVIAFPFAAGVLFPAMKVQVPPWVCVIVMTVSNLCVITTTMLYGICFRQTSVPKSLLDGYELKKEKVKNKINKMVENAKNASDEYHETSKQLEEFEIRMEKAIVKK